MLNYINPALGGIIIGCSAVLSMYLLGRIAGISGIFWQALKPTSLPKMMSQERLWQCLFLLGLPLGVILSSILFNHTTPPPPSSNIILVITSGLLVGLGTKMGSGCTSGHGVCGISRFSLRSITATCTFIVAGIITVYIMNILRGTA